MKRLLTGAVALLLSLAASATTLNPVQLLNPAGSTSGQAIVSSGASTAPAWGAIGYNALPVQIPNSLIGNVSSSTQAPGVVGLPSCASNTNALIYTNGAGFTCNTNINASTLGGQTFASPGTIGSGVASTGAFTTLNASGNDALFYQNSSSQSIPSGTNTTVTTWTKIYDRVNANFNASTGVFTAPATGYYLVTSQLTFSSAAGVAGTTVGVSVNVNGAIVATGQTAINNTGTSVMPATVSAVVLATSGQAIVIQASQNSGVARTLGGALTDYLSIARLP